VANEAQEELTPREREVFELLKQFKSNRQIADALGVDERTAETHVANILHKLGYNDRRELWADMIG